MRGVEVRSREARRLEGRIVRGQRDRSRRRGSNEKVRRKYLLGPADGRRAEAVPVSGFPGAEAGAQQDQVEAWPLQRVGRFQCVAVLWLLTEQRHRWRHPECALRYALFRLSVPGLGGGAALRSVARFQCKTRALSNLEGNVR